MSTEIPRLFPEVAAIAMMVGMTIHVNLHWNRCRLCWDVGLMRLWGRLGVRLMLAACVIMHAKIQSMGPAIASNSVGSWYWFVFRIFIKWFKIFRDNVINSM